MAFDTNGFFQRLFNWANDRDANIKILAERMDDEFNNYKDGIDAIIGGGQAFRGAIKAPNSLEDAPAFTFSGATDTGIFRLPSEDGIGFAVDGVHKASLKDTSFDILDAANVSGKIAGGFGALTTSGTLDWNHESNARAGNGATLLRGLTAANAPGEPGDYYHPFTFKYTNAANGTANMTQLAIPYINGSLHFRTRVGGVWSAWRKVLDDAGTANNMRADYLNGQNGAFYQNANNINAGTLPSARLSGSYGISITGNAATASNATAHINNSANPHGVTKAQVGLGNVTNTSDTDKPVSTAQQTALNGKLNLTGGLIDGTTSVRAGVGTGYVQFVGGTTTNSGYVASRTPAGARAGYGMLATPSAILMIAEGGRYWSFNDLRINGTPISMQKSYESAATAWVANSISTFAHGLAEMPKVVEAVLVMKQNVHGYSIGQEVRLSSDGQYGSTIYSDTANIRFRSTNSSGVYTTRASGSVAYITPAQANLKIRAFA